MEWLEITASSVERAKEQALIHLGVHESDAEFEVLSEARVGLFGRIRQEARVRARVIPTQVRSKEGKGRGRNSRKSGSGSSKRSEAGRPAGAASQSSARTNRRTSTNPPTDVPPRADNGRNDSGSLGHRRGGSDKKNSDKKNREPMMDYDTGPSLLEQADLAESFVRGVADALDVPLTFTRSDVEDGIMRIEADGEDIGLLVGRRGATAQAIDELVRTVLQRSGGTTREGKIRMDVGGIRARRAAALTEFTIEVAQQAVESGQEIALEPMNRLDRKMIHDVIGGIEQVESRSEGEDPHRRVIIGALPD